MSVPTSYRLPYIRTRLRPSKIHAGGVGVFAIIPIKARDIIFDTSNDIPLGDVTEEQLATMPKPVQQMHTDFAMHCGKVFNPPRDFTKMGMFWYLNHSPAPNCVYNLGKDGYYAKRDIKTGEELSVDYKAYPFDSTVGTSGNIKFATPPKAAGASTKKRKPAASRK
jgi:hypothetical protein